MSRTVRDSNEPAKDPAADYRLDEHVGYLLRRVHQRATVDFNSVMADFEITPTQFAALARLDDVGRVSQNELGRLTAMDPATIWGVVSRLTKRGFVRASTDPGDGRLVILELTAEGRTAVRDMKRRAPDVSARTLADLAPEEVDLFLALLRRLG